MALIPTHVAVDFNTHVSEILTGNEYVYLSEKQGQHFLTVFTEKPAGLKHCVKVSVRNVKKGGERRGVKPFYGASFSLSMFRSRLPNLSTGNFVYALKEVSDNKFELVYVRKTYDEKDGIGEPGVGISRY